MNNSYYKTLDEQYDLFVSILIKNKELMDVLDFIDGLALSNYYIAAGSIFQTIWNYFDGKSFSAGIKDIDVIYYDSSDLSIDKDMEYYDIINRYCISRGYDYEIDVSNEARMHLWKKKYDGIDIEPYNCSEDAICKWIATVHAIGVTKVDGVIKVYAPYGLSDIFSRTIRPIKHKYNSKVLYDKKVNSWRSRYDDLNVIEW